MADARTKVLEVSGIFLPWILGIAFIFGDFGYIGAGITVAICLWYGAWNWRAVIHWKWAMIVIGFFAAIAVKSGIMWLVGEEPFVSFAKAGSRIISLFGAAAILAAYEEDKSERIFGWALGALALVIAGITLIERIGKLPWYWINPNSFGMDCCWLFLYAVVRLRRRGGAWAEIGAVIIGLAGGVLLYLEAYKNHGSRTAPIAYAMAFLFVYCAIFFKSRRISMAIVLLAVAGSCYLVFSYSPKINELLSHRQELWNAYAAKGMERPLSGWGYAYPSRVIKLLSDKLLNKPMSAEFSVVGNGPHNSYLAMFFENGIVALLGFLALLVYRARQSCDKPSLYDVALIGFIVFMLSDAMNAGGITFLGFFLGICILAGGKESLACEA